MEKSAGSLTRTKKKRRGIVIPEPALRGATLAMLAQAIRATVWPDSIVQQSIGSRFAREATKTYEKFSKMTRKTIKGLIMPPLEVDALKSYTRYLHGMAEGRSDRFLNELWEPIERKISLAFFRGSQVPRKNVAILRAPLGKHESPKRLHDVAKARFGVAVGKSGGTVLDGKSTLIRDLNFQDIDPAISERWIFINLLNLSEQEANVVANFANQIRANRATLAALSARQKKPGKTTLKRKYE